MSYLGYYAHENYVPLHMFNPIPDMFYWKVSGMTTLPTEWLETLCMIYRWNMQRMFYNMLSGNYHKV